MLWGRDSAASKRVPGLGACNPLHGWRSDPPRRTPSQSPRAAPASSSDPSRRSLVIVPSCAFGPRAWSPAAYTGHGEHWDRCIVTRAIGDKDGNGTTWERSLVELASFLREGPFGTIRWRWG